jgi:hypothetical protein
LLADDRARGEPEPSQRACIAAEFDPAAADWAWRELQALDGLKRERIMLAGGTRANFPPPTATDFRYSRPERRRAMR